MMRNKTKFSRGMLERCGGAWVRGGGHEPRDPDPVLLSREWTRRPGKATPARVQQQLNFQLAVQLSISCSLRTSAGPMAQGAGHTCCECAQTIPAKCKCRSTASTALTRQIIRVRIVCLYESIYHSNYFAELGEVGEASDDRALLEKIAKKMTIMDCKQFPQSN